MKRTSRGLLIFMLIILLLVPTAAQTSSIMTIQPDKGTVTSDRDGRWPDWYPSLNKFFEFGVHKGIEQLKNVPEKEYIQIEFNLEFPGCKIKITPKMCWKEESDHIRYEISLDADWYDPKDDDKLIPEKELAGILAFEHEFHATLSFELAILWFWEDNRFSIPDFEFSGGIYYLIRCNIAKLLLIRLIPFLGGAIYEWINEVAGDALEHLESTEASVGVNITGISTPEVDKVIFEPFARLEVSVPDEEIEFNMVELNAGLDFKGSIRHETYRNEAYVVERTEVSADLNLQFFINWRLLLLGGRNRWTFNVWHYHEIITDKRTELRDFEIANGNGICKQGDLVKLEATLVDSEGLGLFGHSVTFQYREMDGNWIDIDATTTDSNGYCFINWICDLPNDTYEIRAKYDGTIDYNACNTAGRSLVVELDLISIQILDLGFGTGEDYLVVRPEDDVHISTYVNEPGVGGVVGIPIDFFVSNDNRHSWTYVGTSTTGGWGYASVDWIVPPDLEGGNHYFRAAFPGDYTYDRAVSEGEIRLVVESVRITSPTDGATVGTSTPAFTLDISDGITYDRVAFRIDWDSYVNLPAGTTEWTSYSLSEGAHIVRVYLYQGMNVRGADYITITVDAYHPLVILNPQPNDYVQASFAVDWEWQGGEPYDKVELLIDGSIVYSYVYSQTVGVLVGNAGLHSLNLRAWLGETVETASVDFIVDRIRPSINIVSPLTGTEFGSHSVYVEWTASDDNELDRFDVLVDGALIETINSPAASSTTISIDSGAHTIEVFAYDASNLSSGASVDIRVKTAEPWVIITSPQEGAVLGTQTVDLYWEWWSTSSYNRFEIYIDAVYNMTVYNQSVKVRVDTGIHTISVRGYLIDESHHSDSVEIEIDPRVSLVGEWDTGVYVGDAPGLSYAPHRYHYACSLDFCGDSKSEVVVAWLEYNPGSDYIIHLKMYLMGGTELFHWTMISDESVWGEQERIDDIAIVELDGDQQDEMVVSTIYGVIAFNYFDSYPYYSVMWSHMNWGYIHTLDAQDIDNDGLDEIWSGGAALLLDNDGSIIWSYDTVSNDFHTWFSKDPTESKFAELDGDSDVEVLLSGWGNILAGNDDGSEYWIYDYCYDEYSTVGAAHYDVGNVDLDDLDEILIYNYGQYRLTLMDSNSSIIWDVSLQERIYDAVLMDLNNDDISEILLLLGDAGHVNNFTILDSLGDMIRTIRLENTYASPYARWKGIQVADIDNDPDLEIFIPNADRVRVISVDCVVELEADCVSTHWCPTSQFPVDFDGDGQYELGVWFTPPFMVFRITHDIESPIVEILNPLDATTVPSSFVISWTATDNREVIFSLVWVDTTLIANTTEYFAVTSLSEGLYTLLVQSYDARGNIGTDTVDIVVDTTPPSISIMSPVSGFNSSSREVTLAWDAIDYDHVLILLGGWELARTSSTQKTISLPPGHHNITCRAYDEAGNFADDWLLVTVDTTPPDVLILMPVGTLRIAENSTEVSWTIVEHGTGIAGIYLYVNELLIGEQNYSALVTGLVEGMNNITITCLDFAGNIGIGSLFLTVDLTIPEMTILNPSNPAYHNGELDVSVDCYDLSGIQKCQVTVDGVNTMFLGRTSIVDLSEVWTAKLNMSELNDGYHVFSFLVYDGVGHLGSISLSIETVFDTEDPVVLIISPENGFETMNNTVLLRWIATDNIGLDYCEIFFDSVLMAQTVNDSYELTLSEGSHIVSVRAIDLAGNSGVDEIGIVQISPTTTPSTITEPSTFLEIIEDLIQFLLSPLGLVSVAVIAILILTVRRRRG